MEKHQPVITYLIGFLLLTLGLKFIGLINIESIEILSFLMIIFGISYVFLSFGENKKGVLFTSTVIFLSGVITYIVNNFEFFNSSLLLYPSFFLIIGIAFLMIYIDGNISLIYLAVSLLFLLVGLVLIFLRGNFKGSSFLSSLVNVTMIYWPIIFIAVIVYLLVLRGEKKRR